MTTTATKKGNGTDTAAKEPLTIHELLLPLYQQTLVASTPSDEVDHDEQSFYINIYFKKAASRIESRCRIGAPKIVWPRLL